MDFETLSKHDDILASYFLDNLYLWFTTVRMNSDPIHATGEQQMAIEMIQEMVNRPGPQVISIRDGMKQFLEFPYFRDYISKLSLKEVRYFQQHLKRYLLMFSHQAGFEVSSTTRYTGTMEACILATRDWTAGEMVQYCSGAIVELTKEDDAKLKSEGRDFSVMVSTRKKCTCLFLGPARFMNHDCDANCEFMTPQTNTISFKVQRDIRRGEEMTVYYGDHYFGSDNCECRCLSCERMQEGSFSVEKSDSEETEKDGALTPETPVDDENTGGIRRSGRVKKEVDYVYKDVLSPPRRQRSTPPKPSKEEPPSNTIPLVEITNEKFLRVTMEDMKIDNPEQMEINHHAKMQKPLEMGLDYICNERSPPQGPPKTDDPSTHTGMHLEDDYRHSSNSFHSEPKPVDPGLTQFYDWLDDLSDLSDAESSVVGDVNVKPCCSTAKEYKMVVTSTGRELCSRCYRHYKIYELDWPSRKKPAVLPPPPSPPLPPPLPPAVASSSMPSAQPVGDQIAKETTKRPPRKSKSQARAKPKGPRAKLTKQPNSSYYPSFTPMYNNLPPGPSTSQVMQVPRPPQPQPQPPFQAPQIDPIIAAFHFQSLHNNHPPNPLHHASSSFTSALPFPPSYPPSYPPFRKQPQNVYSVAHRPRSI